MSIERDDGRVELCCDACPQGLGKAFPDDQWDEMMVYAKKKGWRIMKVGGAWKHFCPRCDPI